MKRERLREKRDPNLVSKSVSNQTPNDRTQRPQNDNNPTNSVLSNRDTKEFANYKIKLRKEWAILTECFLIKPAMFIESLNQTEHVTGVVVLLCMRENVKRSAILRYPCEKRDAEKK